MSKKGNIHVMCANIPVEDLGEWSRDSDPPPPPPPKYIITSDDCLVAGRPSNSSETDLAGEESPTTFIWELKDESCIAPTMPFSHGIVYVIWNKLVYSDEN